MDDTPATGPRPILPFLLLCLTAGAIIALLSTAMILDKGARAYATGESLWSKGRKDAVHALAQYLYSGREPHWEQYRRGLTIPLADRAARLAMDAPVMDEAAVTAHFLAGGNHPDDIPSMILLYRRLGWEARIAAIAQVWVDADVQILALEALGRQIQDRHRRGVPLSRPELARLHDELDRISAAIDPLETEFGARLGAAAREMQDLIETAVLMASSLLLTLAVFILARFLRFV